jgi:hypothetical protein
MPSNVRWYGAQVNRAISADAARVLDRVAFSIEAQAKVNITDNAQVDTGFMRNSVYTVSAQRNTFASVDATGNYQSRKTGRTVQRAATPNPPDPPEGGAIVGVAAEYAIWQELQQAFLWPAVESVATNFDGIATRA